MPADGRTLLQVGPVLQIPMSSKFHHRRGWYYVYLRSVDQAGVIHESDPRSATAYESHASATTRMTCVARYARLGWAVIRHTEHGPVAVSYHHSEQDAQIHRSHPTEEALHMVERDTA